MPDFDLDTFRKEFEETYEPEVIEEDVETEIEDTTETEVDEIEVDESEEVEETEEDENPSDTELEPDPEPKKQSREENAAFAEMRKQLEAEKKKAAIAEQVAAQYGMTVEQFEQAYAQQQEEARAQTQGIPVDVLRRLEAAENKLAQTEKQNADEKFWASVTTVKEKYGLQDDEIKNVFDFIGREGLINPVTKLPLVDFDKAYKIANFDKIQERKEKESYQKRLADKKARQQKSAIPPTNASTAPTSETDEITDDFVMKRLKERGLL